MKISKHSSVYSEYEFLLRPRSLKNIVISFWWLSIELNVKLVKQDRQLQWIYCKRLVSLFILRFLNRKIIFRCTDWQKLNLEASYWSYSLVEIKLNWIEFVLKWVLLSSYRYKSLVSRYRTGKIGVLMLSSEKWWLYLSSPKQTSDCSSSASNKPPTQQLSWSLWTTYWVHG